MTVTEIAQLLTALAVCGNMLVSLRNGRKIAEVHKTTNGKMEQLLELTAKSSKAEGVAETKAQRPDPPHSLPESELPPTWPERPK